MPEAKLQVIQGYGDGGFTVSGIRHEGSLLVFPGKTVAWSGELSQDSLAPITEADPPVELLLIGCGKSMTLIPSHIRNALKAQGVTIEPMDTGAACRTYNVLVSEERRVAAALAAV